MSSNCAGLGQPAGGGDGVLKIGAARRRRLADGARGVLPVLRLNGVADVGGGEPSFVILSGFTQTRIE